MKNVSRTTSPSILVDKGGEWTRQLLKEIRLRGKYSSVIDQIRPALSALDTLEQS